MILSVAASAAAPVDFPMTAPPNAGLWQVRLPGEWNKSAPIATNEATGALRMPGPVMAHLREELDFRWGGHTFRWKEYETWAYAGYLFMVGGVKYVFGKNFDDSCLIRIDGATVLDHVVWNEFGTGTFVPSETGWHAIEIRLGNINGNAGPFGEWSGARFGLAFNTNGVKSPTPTSAWTPLRDDTGALFRIVPGDWTPPPLPPPEPDALAAMIPGQLAFGGDEIYRVGRDIVHVFRSSGVFRALSPLPATRVLVVGGGGMGGAEIGGGGGGGAVVERTIALETNRFYHVCVGAGARPHPKDAWLVRPGGDSIFGPVVASGGGGGGSWRNQAGGAGGNGGGGSNGGAAGASTQDGGNAGGAAKARMPGGGGGAGAPGGRAEGGANVDAPAGGDGVPNDITGEERWYGGGGGAGQESRGRQPGAGGRGGGGSGTTDPHGPWPENDGVDGTGGGGGGACNNWGVPVSNGGRGGDGIVVVRYRGDWNGAPAIGEVALKPGENRKGRHEVNVEGEVLAPGAGGLRVALRVGLSPAEARVAKPISADYAGNGRFAARFDRCDGAPLFSGCDYFVAIEATDRAGAKALWEGSVRVPPVPVARGGEIRLVDGDVVHVFEQSGRFELDRRVVADVLIVGGGGAGGSAFGGGGGGGGVIELHGVALEPDHYPVTIGAGGQPVFSGGRGAGRRGADTMFLGRRARGGGGGAGWERWPGNRRGTVATGGGASDRTGGGRAAGDGQGFDGGTANNVVTGGGGGAGGRGENGGARSRLRSGAGGAGRVSTITGEAISYGPGGGGGASSNYDSMPGFGGDPSDRVSGRGAANHAETPGAPGRDGRGGGGGGGTWNPATSGGAGGSGCVIVRYTPRPDFPELASLRLSTHRHGIAVEGAIASFGDGARRATVTVAIAPDEASLDAAPAREVAKAREGAADFSALLGDCNGERFEPGEPYLVRVRIANDRGARIERVEWVRAPVRRKFQPRAFLLKALIAPLVRRLAP